MAIDSPRGNENDPNAQAVSDQPFFRTLPKPTRRRLMQLAAAGGISLAAMRLFSPATAFAATPAASGPTGGPTDGATQFAGIPGNNINEQILNFALTLEILEADLYRQALNLASGIPRDTALSVNPKMYSQKIGGGGLSAANTAAAYIYLKEFAYVEGSHRDFLRTAISSLGLTPVAPNPGGYYFPTPLQPNLKNILAQLLPLEETGVRAYLGALPYFTDLGLAQTAGTIYSTEARHSAVINYTLGLNPGPSAKPGDQTVVPNPPAGNTFEYYLKPLAVIAAAKYYFVP